VTSKEDRMLRQLLALSPANLMFRFGTGRALDNARRDREEIAATIAVVDALVGRLDSAAVEAAAVEAACAERAEEIIAA
jgi:hypothetical protein